MFTLTQREQAKRRAQVHLARREFWEYCQTRYPDYYKDDRAYLKYMAEMMQWFYQHSPKRFLVVTLPPRHFKSLTASNFTEWVFGENINTKVMTGSYNETLSTTFARKVRDTIAERPLQGGPLVYRSIFPKTKIKYGQASVSLWALEGSSQDNYLATSPGGTATGFGANLMLIDDIIKNDKEAYNDAVLQGHWDWFTNTMMQRLEGDNYKVIIIMTRWAKGDLAGRIIEAYGDDVEQIAFKAVQDDGSMLCEEVLSKDSYLLKTKEMNPDIIAANYNQEPIDVKGKLYPDNLLEYDDIPEAALTEGRRYNYTDTADKGADYLCSIDYIEWKNEAYVLDMVITDEAMETTEPAVADMLVKDDIEQAVVEANSGGRGWGRNVKREMFDRHGSTKTVIIDKNQTANKEARILSSAAWVKQHIYLPRHYRSKYPDFAQQVHSYQKKGKNAHDDAPDVLAGIYEQITGPANTFRMSL
jgi:predicted phage terminase large subunit-like protein